MCMKGGGGQPLEASWKPWAKRSVMSSSRPSNQQCCIHIVYTVSCFTPCERVSLDRLHADNLLTTQLMCSLMALVCSAGRCEATIQLG